MGKSWGEWGTVGGWWGGADGGSNIVWMEERVEKHEEHALVGVFFMFWRRGMAVVGSKSQ